jgi:hypothetical protein
MRALREINHEYIYQGNYHKLGWLIGHCQYANDISEIRNNTPDLFHTIFNYVNLTN